jgi:RecA-family ATPase
MKSNYGPTGGEIALRWEAGAFRASAAAQTGLDRMAAGTKAERVFLKLLRLFSSEGRDVGHSTGHSFAPAKFVQHPDAEGVTKRAFSAAMDTLFREGKLRVEETGPPSRRTRRIVEVSDDA